MPPPWRTLGGVAALMALVVYVGRPAVEPLRRRLQNYDITSQLMADFISATSAQAFFSRLQGNFCSNGHPNAGVASSINGLLARSGLNFTVGDQTLRCLCAPEWDVSGPEWDHAFSYAKATAVASFIGGSTDIDYQGWINATLPVLPSFMGQTGTCSPTCIGMWCAAA